MNRIFPYLPVIISFTILLTLTGMYDWDFFHATAEVDLRSWLIDGNMPRWSYQFCGGSTRIGDPQSFGQSPLFIFVIIFGPVLGLRLLILATLVFGQYCLTRIWGRLGITPRTAHAYAFSFLTSSFFSLHFLHGHVTFLSFIFILPFVDYFIRTDIPPWKQSLAILTITTFILQTGGGHPGIIYALLPFCLAFATSTIWAFFLKQTTLKETFQRASVPVLALTIGSLLSWYKLGAVLEQQKQFTRSVDTIEIVNPLQIIKVLTLPIVTHITKLEGDYPIVGPAQFYPEFFSLTGRFMEWEYSYFSLFPFFLIVAWKFIRKIHLSSYTRIFLLVSAFLGGLFFCGSFTPWAPYSLLNQYILSNSLRVTGRFLFVSFFSLSTFAVIVFENYRTEKNLSDKIVWFCGVGTFAIILGCLFHHTGFLERQWELINQNLTTQNKAFSEMMLISPAAPPSMETQMYQIIAQGAAVTSCYTPLKTPSLYDQSQLAKSHLPGKPEHFLIGCDGETLNSSCLQKSYFTQSTIHIADSCPPIVCFRFNYINNFAEDKNIQFNQKAKLFEYRKTNAVH